MPFHSICQKAFMTRKGHVMPAPESNPYTPPAISGSSRPAVSKRSKTGLQLVIAVVCCLWLLFCTLWFCAAMYELIGFTLLQDAYGQNTPKFRMAYVKSAAIAFLLGVPAAIILFRLQLRLREYRYSKNSSDHDWDGD